jgi:hypothetical protein
MMDDGVPLVTRLLLKLEGLVSTLYDVREELLFALSSDAERISVGNLIYAQQQVYFPSSQLFQSGLLDWEERLVAHSSFPRAGRILVGGAGAGREMSALQSRGYRTIGFDPSVELVEAGRKALGLATSELIVASYDDLIEAAITGTGPLGACVAAGEAISAVILSFGSISYVVNADDRKRLCACITALAPQAPILLSFLGENLEAKRANASVRLLAYWITVLKGTKPRQKMQRFLPHAGFVGLVTQDEVRDLAASIGYAVQAISMSPYPHALLAPATMQSANLAGGIDCLTIAHTGD